MPDVLERNCGFLIGLLVLVLLAGYLRTPTTAIAGENDCDANRGVLLVERPPVELKLVAKLGPGPAKENSGIVKSRNFPDLFWMHNDSGDEPRFTQFIATAPTTTTLVTRRKAECSLAARSMLTGGYSGRCRWKRHHRRHREQRKRPARLVLYYLDEPSPTAGRTTFRKKVFLRYPDQHEFPAQRNEFNFDCEAVFTVGNTVYLLSKNRSNHDTNLYRLDDPQPVMTNTLTLLGTFNIHGQAVGGDCTPDGKRQAVLTYTGAWLFERDSLSQSFFDGRVSWAAVSPAGRRGDLLCRRSHLVDSGRTVG